MRNSHILAAAVLAVAMLSAGETAAFSLQNSGSGQGGAAAGGSAGAGPTGNYLDTGDKLMREMSGIDSAGASSNLDQKSGKIGGIPGFSMRMEQTGRTSDPVGGRYFSTETNPWK